MVKAPEFSIATQARTTEASWKMNICWSIVRVAKFSPLNSKPCGVITCLAKTNRNPKDFIWVCSIAATQIKVRVWVWICPDIASAIASQNSNNTIKNRKSFRKCYISRTAPRKVGARAPLDRKACGVITWSPRPPKKYFRHRPSSLSTYGYWSSNLYLLEFRHIRAYCRGQQPPIETL